jgi:CBS domain-containing protein
MMQREVVFADIDDSIATVEQRMNERQLSWLPVLEGGSTVIGVISSVDLLQFHALDRRADDVRAWQLCSYKPFTVTPQTPASEVARVMVARRIHHVVVIGPSGLEGVVSSLDFVQRYLDTPA